MNQQINLYLPEFRLKKDPLTFKTMLLIVGGLIALQGLILVYDTVDIFLLSSNLATQESYLEEETRKTDELDEVLARRSQNTQLNERLEAAEARLEASRQIRDFFSRTKLGNTDGFSEYFKDFSRASLDGMSITEFAITSGGEQVELAGQVIDSALVPRYVSNIESGQSPLRNMHFSPSISRDDVSSRLFAFALSSENE